MVVELVGIQPVALVDFVCHAVSADQLAQVIGSCVGGSIPCAPGRLDDILSLCGDYATIPGGSVANVLRGLSKFQVHCRMLGVRGSDAYGDWFVSSMQKEPYLDMSYFAAQEDSCTARCAIVCYDGQRTSRPCFEGVKGPGPEHIPLKAVQGTKWMLLSAYSLYWGTLFEHALTQAAQAGAKVALDLGSKEIVVRFQQQLWNAVEGGRVSCCLGNEEEASALTGLPADKHEDVCVIASLLAQHCQLAVVTQGAKGCVVLAPGEAAVVVPAVGDVQFKDSTGAGDAFACGLLTGILREWPTKQCAVLGTLCGAAAVQAVGGELQQQQLSWLSHQIRLHQLPDVWTDDPEPETGPPNAVVERENKKKKMARD